MNQDKWEESLIRRSLKGHHSAFKELYEKYAQPVFQTVYRLLGERTSAEDITQEVFITIYENLENFEYKSAFGTWCYRITVNKCIDVMRKKNRRQKYKKGTINPDKFDLLLKAEDSEQPDQKLKQKEISRIIHHYLQDMQEELKITFVLREFEQLAYKDIAEVMDCSQGTVASRLARARSNLAEHLEKQGIDNTYLN